MSKIQLYLSSTVIFFIVGGNTNAFTSEQYCENNREPTRNCEVEKKENEFNRFLRRNQIDHDSVTIINHRIYKKPDHPYPTMAKCSPYDGRIFHFCPEARFFNPSARVYFDVGNDDIDEVDLFNDGGVNATIDFVSFYLPWRFGNSF
ncbi:MAG: hypothetical protein AAGH65_10265, partial [Pseudomonadota bacterium]